MPRRPYDLPALNALVSFEAAARHDGFKPAATELNVTPAAISHQVKALEADLGTALFRRHHRGVELTEAGAYLMVALQRSFEGMSDAISQLRSQPSPTMVTIQCTTAVSSLWLTPRLSRFWKSHANVPVTQQVSDVDARGRNCDLSIHYGDMAGEDAPCHLLFRDRISALASPAFAARHPVARIDDFARIPLIHLDSPLTGWTTWGDWCGAMGYVGKLRHGFQVNNYVIALQAAQDDVGAVLGWGGLTERLVSEGRLVKLWPDDIASPLDFYIKVHPNATDRARLFCDWLLKSLA